jgi:hypothetical protein
MSGSRFFVLLYSVLLCVPSTIKAASLQALEPAPIIRVSPADGQWTATQVEHIYGLSEIKRHQKGTLTLSAEGLTFTGKSGSIAIPMNSISAASAGNQRVEMWGVPGRILRMAIPDNGGLAVAAFAHHRIDMLTVEFSDGRGGTHSAVFFLGAHQGEQAIQHFALEPRAPQEPIALACQNAATEPGSVLVAAPDWSGAQVPAAYRGLMYEHLIERFRKAKSLPRVYRDGESIPEGLCPQYTVHLSVTSFKQGSSIERAMLGPVGMFIGTTQMVFNMELSDRTGNVDIKEQVKATIRGESESTNVADKVAKTLEKKYDKAVKASEKKAHVSPDATKS